MTAIETGNLLKMWVSRARHAEADLKQLRAENERLTAALASISYQTCHECEGPEIAMNTLYEEQEK